MNYSVHMEQIRAKVSKLVRDLRLERRYSYRDLAAELNVKYNAVFKWEKGQSLPEPERTVSWMKDARPWVKQFGFNVWSAMTLPAMQAAADAAPAPEGI